MSEIFYQALLFGVILLLIGLFIAYLFNNYNVEKNETEKYYYKEEITIFLSGFIIRYLLEINFIKQYLYNCN